MWRLMTRLDYKDHPSIQRIQHKTRKREGDTDPSCETRTQGRVLAILESLNTDKATGCDGIPAKVMKIGAEELSQPLTIAYSAEIGLQLIKRNLSMASILKKTTGQ